MKSLKQIWNNPILFYSLIILSVVLIQFIYVYVTPFTKTIMIKQKNAYSTGKYMRNTVVDENGSIYTVTSSLPVLHFTAAEVWNSIEVGKTYTAKGNGIRVPILSLYPNIVSIHA